MLEEKNNQSQPNNIMQDGHFNFDINKVRMNGICWKERNNNIQPTASNLRPFFTEQPK